MSLVLRVDVDKPFGNSNLIKKIGSKLIEDCFGSISTSFPGYLAHQTNFLELCNNEKIPGFFYYRRCTVPNKKVERLMQIGGHKYGLHAENTRSLETLTAELNYLRKKVSPNPVQTFTKHGSGVLKLGKYHYPNYEPDLYLEWSNTLNCSFHFGNSIPEKPEDLTTKDNYHSAVFWIETEYRSPHFKDLEQLLHVAKTDRVIVLIHPENFDRDILVKEQFMRLIQRAKEENISWEVF